MTEGPGKNILVIEDDPVLQRGLCDNFSARGYGVEVAGDGETGLAVALSGRIDLILLDIMLPAMNGYEVCRRVRAEGLELPIIMLTAKGQEEDLVQGLNLGADDYVTKPFSIRELVARVQAFLRRHGKEIPTPQSFGEYQFDLQAHRLMKSGVEIELTPKEFQLLRLFVERSGRALTRDEILRVVWGHGVLVTYRSVDRCVTTLRAKIEPDPRKPRWIRTIRDVGYRFGT